MKSLVKVTALLVIMGLALASTVTADVPHMINYQGFLTDSTGAPIDTVVAMTFSIYDAGVGGTLKWTETHSSVTVTGGTFNVILGMGTPPVPVDDAVFDQPDRWLGITIGTSPEITPRSRLASVPYSHRVSTVDRATGGTVQSGLDVDGDIHASGTLSSGSSITIDGVLNTISSSTDKISFTNDSLVDIEGIGVGSSSIGTNGIIVNKTITTTAPSQSKGIVAYIDNPGSGLTWGGDFGVTKDNDGSCLGVAGVANLDGGVAGDFACGAHGYATSTVNARGIWGYSAVDSIGSGLSTAGEFNAKNFSVAGINTSYGVYSEATSDFGPSYGGWFRGGSPTSTAANYGIYATVMGTGTTFAGYFDGDVTVSEKLGIGTTNPQGALDVSSTTGALIVPRMTTTERDALTPVNGMIIYNTTIDKFNFYENGAWVSK